MNRSNGIKYWVMFIVIGCFSLSLGCTANYPVSGIALMPLCDCQTILRAAQNIMVDSGYTVLQSDPEMGLISVQKEFSDIVRTVTFLVRTDKDKGVRMLMEVDTSELIAPPPLRLTRIELVNITKMIAQKMGFSENDVFVQFGKG